MTILIGLFAIFYCFLAYFRFETALFFIFFLLPVYLIRFTVFNLPTTLLELMFAILVLIWLKNLIADKNFRQKTKEKIIFLREKHKSLLFATGLFLLGATIGVAISLDTKSALGEWKAFYIEPIVLALLVFSSVENKKGLKKIMLALVLSAFATSVLAIYQKFTGFMVPWDFWENRDTYRVTGWWGFPNGVGLYLALALPFAVVFLKNKKKWKKYIAVATIFLGISAIVFAKSSGALIALVGVAFIYFCLKEKTRKIAIFILLCGFIGFLLLPSQNSIKQEILMKDRSGQLRINMWAETTEFLLERPVFGAGLASYQKLIYPYRIDKRVEVFHHPHNGFLTMWVNIGFVGLFSFVWLLVWFFKNTKKTLSTNEGLAVFLSFIAFLITGLVDSPYIKNDIAMIFWLFLILPICLEYKKTAK